MNRLSLSLALAALLATGAAPAAPRKPAAPVPAQQTGPAVSLTAEGTHLLGNPQAPVKVVEYVSYTCPHCAHFHEESTGPLQAQYLSTGRASVEVRPFLRNAFDVTATLLANCGSADRFYGNHDALLRRQSQWLRSPGAAELKRWQSPDFATRTKAMARDLGLFKLMQERGYKPAELDRCLSDRAGAQKLADQTQHAVEVVGVQGTPSFTINGKLQEFFDWANLRRALEALTAGFS